MKADELREALEVHDSQEGELVRFVNVVIIDAARERLAQLEGDEFLLQRITDILWGAFGDFVPLSHYETAKRILNALTTSTDEGEG